MAIPQDPKKWTFDLGSSCTKYILIALNFVFIVICVVVISGAIPTKIVLVTYNDYYSYHEKLNGMHVLSTFWLVVGISFMLVAVFGIFAAFKESSALMNLYGIAMILVFLLQISTAVTGFSLTTKSRDLVYNAFDTMMVRYNDRPSDQTTLDWIQSKFECCGIDNPSDWMFYGTYNENHITRAWYPFSSSTTSTQANPTLKMPASCCKANSYYNNLHCDEHYENGCFNQIHKLISDSIIMIGCTGLIFSVMQILGIVLGFIYARIVRSNKSHRDILIWNSQSVFNKPVYADYVPIDNRYEVKQI